MLQAAREVADGGRVHVVFGCGGDRDRSKRAPMGAVAARLADRVVVTSDNPRSEDPAAIIDAIVSGIPDRRVRSAARGLVVEPDRRAAIAAALAGAAPGDVVVIAGKGHETTQTIGRPGRALRRPCRRRGSCWLGPIPAGGHRDRPPDRRRRGMAVSLFGTRFLIELLRRTEGRPTDPRGRRGPRARKAGTPTMGGLAIVGAALVGYIVAHLREGVIFTDSGLLLMAAIGGAGAVGLLDDWLKVTRERNLGSDEASEDPRPAAGGDRVRGARGPLHPGAHDAVVHPLRLARHRTGRRRLDRPRRADHLRHLQRGEPHRRARRAGRRLGALRVHRLHGHRVLGLPPQHPHERHLPPRQRARPRACRGRVARRVRRVPVVERHSGADLHGRHRLAGHRHRARRARADRPTPSCCCRSSAACSCWRRCR